MENESDDANNRGNSSVETESNEHRYVLIRDRTQVSPPVLRIPEIILDEDYVDALHERIMPGYITDVHSKEFLRELKHVARDARDGIRIAMDMAKLEIESSINDIMCNMHELIDEIIKTKQAECRALMDAHSIP